MFSGVFSRPIIRSENAYPAAARTTERMQKLIRLVEMLSFTRVKSFLPKALLVMTIAPAPPPTAIAMNTALRAALAPTAASADSPMKRPTIMESAIV